MIAGDVVPPACYLDATEILRRQYFASLVDRGSAHAKRPDRHPPREGRLRRGTRTDLVARAASSPTRARTPTAYVDEFLPGSATTR